MKHILVSRDAIGPVDSRLFGQFLERATFGETGPESVADPATGRLPSAAIALLEFMRIPVIRFPGGSDVDRIDWRDMIDNVPGRAGPRPVTTTPAGSIGNRFGYDEYFALRDALGCETIIVLNLMDAVMKRKALPEAVRDAVGLVAYCNAPLGARLPPGMPDWPAIRATNGHPQPHGCQYVQIGNEWRFKLKDIAAATGLQRGDEMARWFVTVLHAFIAAIRAIDPAVKIVIDGHLAGMERIVLSDERIREATFAAAFHVYAPGPAGHARREAAPIDPAELRVDEWWYGLASIPGTVAADGNIVAVDGDQFELAKRLGYRVVCTEWNWNGWGFDRLDGSAAAEFFSRLLPAAKAVGAAGFLHGLMRQGSDICLATQSMLLGHNWGIAAVRVDPSGRSAPRFQVQGLVTTLYSRCHGDRLLRVEHEAMPSMAQPNTIGLWTKWPQSVPMLALLDVAATARDNALYLHVIHRHIDQPEELCFDLAAWPVDPARAMRHGIALDGAEACRIDSQAVVIRDGRLCVQVPPHSVSVFELPLRAT